MVGRLSSSLSVLKAERSRSSLLIIMLQSGVLFRDYGFGGRAC
jgi:hypothetical protein